MAPKIKDVARKAGVSVTTVSRVLNGEKYVKDDLKDKVKRAIADLGYTPSHIARSLVRKRTNLIGVIVPDLTSSFYSTILSNIEETASQNGYSLMVCNIMEDIDKEFKYLQVFKEMRVDGVIIMHEKMNDEIRDYIDRLHIPIIFSSVKPAEQNYVSVIVDDYQAAYDATRHLIGLGHRRIAYIGGDMRDVTSGQNRYIGYCHALADSGMALDERYNRFGDYKTKSGYALMKELLGCEPRPTAVFAVSDDMAVGAINCLHDLGIAVPDDISVVGFDGSQLTELVRPRLSSMEQPIDELGKVTVDALIEMIDGRDSAPKQDIVLAHKLVIRDSCRPIRDNSEASL